MHSSRFAAEYTLATECMLGPNQSAALLHFATLAKMKLAASGASKAGLSQHSINMLC